MKIMTVSYDDIRTMFKDNQYVLENLENFLIWKEKFAKEDVPENRNYMKMYYMEIYEDIKSAYYCHKYSYETFLAFKECLTHFDEDDVKLSSNEDIY